MARQRLFKYSVIKYVPDDIRDEPVNVGVLLRSAEGGEFVHRIASDLESWEIPDAPILREALDKLVAEYDGTEPLEEMSKRMRYKIRLTPPRSMVAGDVKRDGEALFNEFVGGGHYVGTPVPDAIRRHVWDVIGPMNGLADVPVSGRSGTFTFDYGYEDGGPRLVSIIPFGDGRALDRTKALDWSVSDIMAARRYGIGSFRPLLVMPRGIHREEAAWRDYSEAEGILGSRGYRFAGVDADGGWRDAVDALLRS